jgi:hypothetical protein
MKKPSSELQAPETGFPQTMKILIPLALLTGVSGPLQAATTTGQFDFIVGTAIPDNDALGFTDTRSISTTITSITAVTIQISMEGGWSGDMYAYVTHASGFAVLLNRPGRKLGDLIGSGVDELVIEFGDNALTDVHTALPSSGAVTGFFQPDARNIDPDDSLDTTPRTAFLSSFNGVDANGDWTLFVADTVTGDQMTLNGWSLEIQGVPEPTTAILAAFAAIGLLRRRRN